MKIYEITKVVPL